MSTDPSPPKADYVWIDGTFVPWEEAKVHVLTHTLHYGLGVFEGIRAYETHDGRVAVFRLREHLRRFLDSARICLLPIPYTLDVLADACLETVRRNGARPCYLRPLAIVGPGQMGLGAMSNRTVVVIATWEWGAYLGEENLKTGIRAKVSSFTRPHVNTSMVKGKIVGQYVNSILAKREALLDGFDEAILLDPEGFVSEASGENVFCVRGGTLYTTPETGSILAGITRDTVLRLAESLEIPVVETRYSRDVLWTADEVFMTGTAAEVTPVREIDGRTIGTGTPGPVTQRVQAAYFRAVRGEAPESEAWLTYL
ncbi:MAG: branched-chain amino acid transaminase [Deltaproteobacteria bacterium]|nr:MAG: branched-chain amino acid transaminase [Deltaproteobacteria bacterium]